MYFDYEDTSGKNSKLLELPKANITKHIKKLICGPELLGYGENILDKYTLICIRNG